MEVLHNKEIGPNTPAHNTFVGRENERILENIEIFKEIGEPVSLWSHQFLMSDGRGVRLTQDELNKQVYSVLHMCGVEDDYMRYLKLIKVDSDKPESPPEAFAANGMGPTYIFEWLADKKALWKEFANDYKTAALFDTPTGLVMFKCTAEEEGILCGDCDSLSRDIESDFYIEPGHSCDHFEGELDVEFQYQISLFPKDSDLMGINYTVWGRYDNVP